MKNRVLLKLLRVLIVFKRIVWQIGKAAAFIFGKFFHNLYRAFAFLSYKIGYQLKRLGFSGGPGWFTKRDFLQSLFFVSILLIALPQTKVVAQKNNLLTGQKTIAYALSSPKEEYGLEEVNAENLASAPNRATPEWRQGTVSAEATSISGETSFSWRDQEIASIVAGGTAVTKPIIMPGVIGIGKRNQTINYVIEPGDSLSNIARDFSVNVATILWENNLSERSILRPGDTIKIPPTSGVTHTVKRGDTIKKIASQYQAKEEDIIKFNNLKEDGSDLVAGEKIMVPGGIKVAAKTTPRAPVISQNYNLSSRPASSKQAPGASGFVWPAGVRVITQYYNWKHHAIDVAGGKIGTPIYAAKAGTVEKSQCGWNGGYGCHVIVNHGNGVKTLYAHNSRLLVSVGEYVEAGQTIALMGNTGNVRGVTGIHLHFEVRVNGVLMNPLSYVR